MSIVVVLTLLTVAPSFEVPAPGPPPTEVHRAWGVSVLGGGVIIAGWVAGLAAYESTVQCTEDPIFFTGLTHSVCSTQSSALSLVPLVGPFIALTDPATARAGLTGVMVAAGLAQVAGLALVIAGPLIRIDGPHGRLSINLAPGAGTAPTGMSLTGRF
jgi:hypothetical protein